MQLKAKHGSVLSNNLCVFYTFAILWGGGGGRHVVSNLAHHKCGTATV